MSVILSVSEESHRIRGASMFNYYVYILTLNIIKFYISE